MNNQIQMINSNNKVKHSTALPTVDSLAMNMILKGMTTHAIVVTLTHKFGISSARASQTVAELKLMASN